MSKNNEKRFCCTFFLNIEQGEDDQPWSGAAVHDEIESWLTDLGFQLSALCVTETELRNE